MKFIGMIQYRRVSEQLPCDTVKHVTVNAQGLQSAIIKVYNEMFSQKLFTTNENGQTLKAISVIVTRGKEAPVVKRRMAASNAKQKADFQSGSASRVGANTASRNLSASDQQRLRRNGLA